MVEKLNSETSAVNSTSEDCATFQAGSWLCFAGHVTRILGNKENVLAT